MPNPPPKAAAKAAVAAVVATPVPKAAVKAAGSKTPQPKAPKAVAKVPAEHADTAPVTTAVAEFDMLSYLMAQNTDLPEDVAAALENDLGDEASSAGPRVLLG